MYGPRYRSLLSSFLLLCVLALVMGGCRREPPENPYAPNGEYFDRLDAAGQRVLLVDGDDERQLKLRKRISHYKVYDADMQALGRIRWEPSSTVRSGPRAENLRMERLGAEEAIAVVRRADDVFEVPGVARMERTTRGWAMFAASGDVMGSLERTDEGWELAPTYDGDEALRVVDRDGASVLMRGDQALLRVRGGEIGELELLMQGLDELDPLERTLVGAWFHSRGVDDPEN